METRVEIVAVIAMTLAGLSHLLCPRAWVEFFTILREKREAGVLAVGMMHLPLGLLIVVCHNRWGGWPTVLTVLGYSWTFKSALYLLFPRVGLVSLSRVTVERAWLFRVAGGAIIVLAAVVAVPLFRI